MKACALHSGDPISIFFPVLDFTMSMVNGRWLLTCHLSTVSWTSTGPPWATRPTTAARRRWDQSSEGKLLICEVSEELLLQHVHGPPGAGLRERGVRHKALLNTYAVFDDVCHCSSVKTSKHRQTSRTCLPLGTSAGGRRFWPTTTTQIWKPTQKLE